MNWYSSDRNARFNPDWPKVRLMILERDHRQCQWPVMDWRTGLTHKCLAPANEVDHKVRHEGWDDDSPSNLWALCRWHHKDKTARESGAARRANRRRREEAAWYSHPAFNA